MMKKLTLILIALIAFVQGAWATDYNVSNETELRGAIENGANITLTQDITIGSAITFNNGITVTIDLGGHTLNRNSTSDNRSQIIGVFSGSTLNISNGTLTGGWGGDGGIINQATLNMTNVTISGNKGNDRGGGISNNGTLTMTDCTVTGNTSLDATDPAGGGGIFNYQGKTATLTNCTITDNTANTYGGGGICNYGTMTLNNCSLSGNNANTTGGGIFCSTTSTLNINGCEITGNSAVSYGDGIYIDNSTFNMQGLCTVTGNTDSNIYLYGSGTVITVTGAFTDGSNIGLGSTDNIRAYTSGYSTYNSATPDNYFSFDNGSYAMGLKNGEVYPGIYYVECSWDGGDTDGHVVSTNKICTDYSQYNGETELSNGWYLLSGSHTGDDEYKKRITIDGNVNFILQDGCDVEFDKGIFIKENKTLTIYGQTAGTGYLHTDGSDGENGAIGGNEDERGGNVVIHGGKIYAKPGSNNCAAIGAGNGKYGMQSITIYGGNIAAEGKSSGAGIGGGQKNRYDNDPYFGSYDYTYTSPSVTIYGGTIMAKGGNYAAGIGGGEGSSNGDIRIYGGNITATAGKYAAGIGSGENTDLRGEIFIYGGTVKATGGEYGAGIGAGKSGESSYRINIYGGNITATAGKEAAGIGGGGNGGGHLYGCITIEGGTVTAEGGEKAAGIGSGKGGTIKHESADYSMYFSGGNIYATGGKYGPGVGIGSEGSIEIRLLYMTGGHLEAKSRGGDAACIGGGKKAPGSTVVINSGTVKCIYTNEYSNEYDKKYPCQYVGQGGSNEDLDDGSFSLGEHTHTVYKDGNRMTANNRYGAVRSHPGGNSTVSIEYCDHDGASYAYVNDTYHRYYCSYCTSSSQQHDGNPCSKCELGSGEYTVTLYEANEDGTGYSTTPIVETLGYQNKYTLPQCGTVPTNKEFMGWKKVTGDAPATIEAEDSELSSLESAGSSFNISENVTYYARYQTCWTGSGTGSSDNPYLINNIDDWDYLADKVNSGNFHYKGKYFKLTDNISVTSQVSKSEGYTKYFSGIFYGDSHTLTYTYSGSSMGMAPFGYAKNATFSDLHVAGSINISGGGFDRGYSGGLVSCMTGSNTISNCRSSVQINSNRDCNGGFVADLQNGSVTVTRCIFDGILTGSGSNSSGFVGMQPSGYTPTINISNSLFIPSQVSMGTNESYTFASSEAANVTIDNCYYSQTFGTAQGTQAYTIESGTDDLWLYYGDLNYGDEDEAIAELQYFENKIFPFDNGLLYQKKFYTIGTANVTFTPVIPGYIATGLSASAGSLTDNLDYTFTLAMNSANSTINATGRTAAVIRVVDEAPYWDSISTGWVFISSPLTDATMPTTVYGLVPEIESRYDLYQLNPSTTKWENWKVGDNTNVNPGFDLVNGKGYLYATKDGTTLVFTGTFNNESTKTIENLPVGFNLVGNPFTDSATINKPYYTLNSDGSAVQTETSSEAIPPCHGVIVEATSANDSVVFTRATQQSAVPSNSGLNIALTQANTRGASTGSAALLDNAIITFNEGSQLGKFYFGKQNANIYIPQGGQEYAIAFSDGQGEMPLNFKAKENGTYTLSVNPEGVELAYLHLIDNITGADVDLLTQASYTFQAKITDYASRFRLVFATQTDADTDADAPFAFISNGNIIITGEGTLQVMDMMGRVIRVCTDGVHTVSTNGMPAGVYVLRLINGENSKTQKIVIQ